MVRKGVFTITNKKTGKVYVGSSNTNLDQLLYDYWQRLKAGNHHNKRLQSDFNRYGSSKFDKKIVIGNCSSEAEVLENREKLLKKYKNNTYNEDMGDVTFNGGNSDFKEADKYEKINEIMKDLEGIIDKSNLKSYNKSKLKDQIQNREITSASKLNDKIEWYRFLQSLEDYDINTAKEYYHDAIKLKEEENYEKAIECCEKAMKHDPDNFTYQYELQELKEKLEEQRYNEAMQLKEIKECKKAIKEYEEEIRSIEEAIELDPNNLTYQYELQELKEKLEEKKQTRAEQHYNKSIELEKKGNYKKALKSIKEAIKINPKRLKYQNKRKELKIKRADEFYQKALILEKKGDYSGALHTINNAIQLDPNNITYPNIQKKIKKKIKKKKKMKKKK